MKEYNTTQLDPQTTFERHVYHRDQFAHYLRWTYVLKIANIGMNILDFGCGTKANLAEVLYRNRYKANKYLGLDIRNLDKAREKFSKVDWVNLQEEDLVKLDTSQYYDNWDIIVSFEVIEHIGKSNGDIFLHNIKQLMNENTVLLLSTPVYNEKVGAANNHVINGVIGEYGFEELKQLLEKYFLLENVWGTFASQTHYKEELTGWKKEFFDACKDYFDSNLISNMMAPIVKPEHARNCLWRLRLK